MINNNFPFPLKYVLLVHAWKLLPKIGPSKCPALPSPLVQNLARPFSSRAKSKNSLGFPPLCGGNGTSTQFLAAKSQIYEGKAFFWYLVYHIAFSFRKIRQLWKSTSTPSISSEISGSSGLLKVIYLSLLPPNFEKVKPYFSRKSICLSFLWKKWLILWASEGEFLFEKLVKIFVFDRRPLNFGLKFELVWEPRRNLFGGLLNVLREPYFHSVSWQEKNVTSVMNIYQKVRSCRH